MAIVYERLGCFEEARWGLVNGLESSTPGRDRKWCERAVQGKEFGSRRWGFEYKWENILQNHYTHSQDATGLVDCEPSGREILSCSADWIVEGFAAFRVVRKCVVPRLNPLTFRSILKRVFEDQPRSRICKNGGMSLITGHITAIYRGERWIMFWNTQNVGRTDMGNDL